MAVSDSFFNLGNLYRFWGIQPTAARSSNVATMELPRHLSWIPVVRDDASLEEKKRITHCCVVRVQHRVQMRFC